MAKKETEKKKQREKIPTRTEHLMDSLDCNIPPSQLQLRNNVTGVILFGTCTPGYYSFEGVYFNSAVRARNPRPLYTPNLRPLPSAPSQNSQEPQRRDTSQGRHPSDQNTQPTTTLLYQPAAFFEFPSHCVTCHSRHRRRQI